MNDASQDARILEKIAGFFKGSRWLQGYVRGKLRMDPAYRAVLAEMRRRPQPLLDIGCGLGLLAFSLREHGVTDRIVGVDCDASKIARAAEIAAREYNGLAFSVGDARDVSGEYGAVVLLDVLHYLDDASQRTLLEGIAARMPPGGWVIVRNTPKDGSLRYRLTYLEELFVRGIGWIRGGGAINFPTRDVVAAPFRERGFEEEIRPLWGRTPFNSYLFVFRRTDPVPESRNGSRARKDRPEPGPERPETRGGVRDAGE